MLLRLLTTALCAASVAMLVTVELVPVHPPRELVRCPAPGPEIAVVDVAGGVASGSLPALVRLRAGERITAVNERAVDVELDAPALIASLGPRAGEFVDLTVTGRSGERRVLLLLH